MNGQNSFHSHINKEPPLIFNEGDYDHPPPYQLPNVSYNRSKIFTFYVCLIPDFIVPVPYGQPCMN